MLGEAGNPEALTPPMKRMESEQAAFWIPAFGEYDDGRWGDYLALFTQIDRGFRRSHTPQSHPNGKTPICKYACTRIIAKKEALQHART